MYCLSLISVVVLGLILLLGTEAFVNGNNNSRQRRGARGQTSTTTRTSPAAPATVLHMAPKKAKKKAAAVPSAETLRKKDVVAAVSEQCDMTKTDAEAAVSAIFATISDMVVEGNRVNVAGFGTFEPRSRAARKGRNPKTGEEITIQASTSCGFSAAKQLKDRLNGRD